MSAMEEMDKDVEFFSMESMKHNEQLVDFCRTAMCVVSGCIAGVMGLQGLSGFALMVALYVVTSLALLVFKLGFDLKTYFNIGLVGFVFSGLFGHLLSYILFWTLSYGLVHIY
ncbi:hypothetical protein Poli38472_001817 [Pythium oligandrum]|uniref:ER membrane protein complex subunit 6 n=1 Tax=Pythium oligandrum TaxID=41045 RepID=A0A8K1FNR1_PYTOL|nr:hypothetical protein Poli38472_001817 [Pythium oligandrum]|eukprot:TMW69661.1 hypothetical protein Poli38472_001817 [Pythium oligandrum]